MRMPSRHAREQSGRVRLLGPFAPRNLAQWVLLFAVVLVFVSGVGTYTYARILAPVSLTKGSDATYRWDGGKLVLKGNRQNGGACTVVPDDGARRRLEVGTDPDLTVARPWFTGAADVVSCSNYVSVWLGGGAELAAVVLAPASLWVYAIGLGLLVVFFLLVGPKTRRTRAP